MSKLSSCHTSIFYLMPLDTYIFHKVRASSHLLYTQVPVGEGEEPPLGFPTSFNCGSVAGSLPCLLSKWLDAESLQCSKALPPSPLLPVTPPLLSLSHKLRWETTTLLVSFAPTRHLVISLFLKLTQCYLIKCLSLSSQSIQLATNYNEQEKLSRYRRPFDATCKGRGCEQHRARRFPPARSQVPDLHPSL